MKGRLYGIGVGPGDPELLTLKAARIIGEAKVIAYLVNDENFSLARNIATEFIADNCLELPLAVPMRTDRYAANQVYDDGAQRIAEQLDRGHDVVVLCEGDPLFYASFIYLFERLQSTYACTVIPGISAIPATCAQSLLPLTTQLEKYAVVTARLENHELRDALLNFDSVAILKVGRHRERIIQIVREANRAEDAIYAEYVGQQNEKIVRNLRDLEPGPGPYFSLMLISRHKS
ncbi:MAG: precorrin-2 C(20)-methyltransferase [Gammaproteobacteria bacterium]|nr:precorrin-2 C(20)-methyltransferase [Gammaproteobacteria bacterium]